MQIQGTTKLLGVIGYPVKHSRSPLMHNAAIAHLNLDYVYVPFPIAPEDLETAVAGFAAIGVVGFSVTIPHKQTIMPLLREISPLAQQVGAVNTVWWNGSGWFGTNTDVTGFVAPLKDRNWNDATAVILGNGGAARATVVGCFELGFKQVIVVGRDRAKLEAFSASWQGQEGLQTQLWDDLPEIIAQAALLVNTTPIGMSPQIDQSPVSQELLAKLPKGAIAYDLIYTPSPTLFLQSAQALGITAIDGREMLVQQGATALQLWLQQPVPVAVMRNALFGSFSG